MGKAISLIMRPVKTFNIENRAHRVISREKPVPAPLHISSKKQLEFAQANNPEFMETHYKKDEVLDQRLKNVFVQSRDPKLHTAEGTQNPDRPLPFLTRSGKDHAYGFWVPEEASEGKCTLATAMSFVANHMDDAEKHNASEIAKKYKLDVKDVENILTYIRVYKVVVPDGDAQLAYTERKAIDEGTKKE